MYFSKREKNIHPGELVYKLAVEVNVSMNNSLLFLWALRQTDSLSWLYPSPHPVLESAQTLSPRPSVQQSYENSHN